MIRNAGKQEEGILSSPGFLASLLGVKEGRKKSLQMVYEPKH
jgi:hypothetical protein